MTAATSATALGTRHVVLETWAGFHARGFAPRTRAAVLVAALASVWLLLVLPTGDNPGAGHAEFDPVTREHRFADGWTTVEVAGIGLGIAAAYMLLLSPLLAYRYPLGVFVPARWRMRIHVWTGWTLLALSVGHGAILPLVRFYEGWASGLIGLGVLAAHGASGAFKGRLVARWGAARWHWAHVTSAWCGLAVTLLHAFQLHL